MPDNDAEMSITWRTPTIAVDFHWNGDSPVRSTGVRLRGEPPLGAETPIVEVFHAGDSHGRTNLAWQTSAVGARLRYRRHSITNGPRASVLVIEQHDPESGLVVIHTATAHSGVGGVHSTTTVRNDGAESIRLESVTSFLGPAFPAIDRDRLRMHWARNEWLAEYRWEAHPIAECVIPSTEANRFGQDPRGRFAVVGRGTWSTGEFLPSGILERDDGVTVGFQVESSGAWSFEVSERFGGIDIGLCGPTDHDSSWSTVLAPGATFTTVPAAVVISSAGCDGAIAELTAHRRALRGLNAVGERPTVVYNDYMNTVGGDPTSDVLESLIPRAADIGAEVFCIDAGWYDKETPFDDLGDWTESTHRFPQGLDTLLASIRDAGMTPGLWLEPEAVGVDTSLAMSLPADAFWSRGGHRLKDWGRHHLDLRHPEVRRHLDATVDDLVGRLGVGYLKLDYNVDFGSGTDVEASSPGSGALGHQRALYDWLSALHSRHPALQIETCSSGALRCDYGLLAHSDLQSSSDQQDALRYAAIACASPSAIVPEQAGNWAYPQPEMSDEEIVFTLCNGIGTRLYLSGWLDRMSAHQIGLVREAVTAHKRVRSLIGRGTPRWPLGLPRWNDEWLAVAIEHDGTSILTVWHRPSLNGQATTEVRLPWPHPIHAVEELFPGVRDGWSVRPTSDAEQLLVRDELSTASARSFIVRS